VAVFVVYLHTKFLLSYCNIYGLSLSSGLLNIKLARAPSCYSKS